MATPTTEPREIIPGETLVWDKYLADYLPSAGWILSYAFRGNGAGFDVIATGDGDTFNVLVPAGDTDALVAGPIYWQWKVELDGAVYTGRGQSTVLVNLAELDDTDVVDNRSFAKKTIDAIDAMLAGKVTNDVMSYTIGNRSLQRMSSEDLLNFRKYYGQLYDAELASERNRNGLPPFRTIPARFTRPN